MTLPDPSATEVEAGAAPALALPHAASAWMEPAVLSSPAPWAGHIPFAAWLMAATRPRTLVELGVYSGISYLAFCQAAVQHGVPLRAWGVDTWQGDAHAGHYGQRVLDALRQQHDGPYGHFSTLLQKTFDEALDDVADSSVDLLHIDGLHTYEAVRHDFESWSPKLSRRAVVLFHDIAVRQGDFGVWRFWAEITQRYPSLAFGHSNGLGVLLAGPQAPAELLALTRDTARWRAARAAFAVLGERFELRARCQHLQAELAGEQARSQARHEWIGQQDAQLLAASRAVEQAAGRQRAAEQAAEQAISQQRAAEQAAEQAARQAREDQKESEVRLRQAAQALHAARAQAHALQAQVDAMLASRSWRVTAGLRWLGRLARRLRAATLWRRTRSALKYLLTGNWRALIQRVRHVRRQAADMQRLAQFSGQPSQSVRCGILATPHTLYVAHALQTALARAGLPAGLVQEAKEAGSGWPLALYFVVCPQMFDRLPPGEKRMTFQMEQTVSSRWFTPEYLATLENSLAALDYAQANIANLADYGIVYPHIFLVPIGGIVAYPQWLGGAAQADESCDVLFYGDANAPRRRRLLDAVARRFKLRIVGNAFGPDMRRALAGAKAVINLHYYEGALLETTRIYECLSLGVPVVSERAADQAEHALLEDAVRFAPVGDEAALLAALQETLDEQASEAGRAAWARRCQAAVAASQARFEFMLWRMLLARRVISYAQFDELTAASALPPLADRVALSLPETPARRQAFEAVRPPGVQLFDGLRYLPGWVGCALSYKHLARRALRQGLPQIEIMEDDVVFAPGYAERRQRVQAWLDRHAGQ
ncbi:class I SAM-dependent methyltransferase [uncultured Ottowia sp.]|uniref:class I SAM-dependent methyltransferase n=1 Tax=uncultured Ottowia sp. TaxID=543067 RepID=UPI0025945072|nr:class I SAM-dependent methyltransferase [uncultured Ottowia sp.]